MLGRLAASAAPMPWEQPSGCPCVRRGLSPPPPDGWWPGRASRALPEVRGRRRASNSCHIRPIPCTAHPRGARFVATGTSMRVAERAGGRGPTVRVPGVAAAAATAAAALSAARRSRESGFQGACSASVWMAPGIRRRSARGQLGEAPGRLPLGWARPGGHPRPRRRWSWPRRSVSAALIVVCDCVCVLSKKIDVTDVSYYTYTQLHDE